MCSADGPLYILRWLQNANLELKFCLCFLSVNKNAQTNMIFPLHYNVFVYVMMLIMYDLICKVDVGIMGHLSLIINFSGENHWNKDTFLLLHN